MADTSARLSKSTWMRLNQRKQAPGESIDDVMTRVLDKAEKYEQTTETEA